MLKVDGVKKRIVKKQLDLTFAHCMIIVEIQIRIQISSGWAINFFLTIYNVYINKMISLNVWVEQCKAYIIIPSEFIGWVIEDHL